MNETLFPKGPFRRGNAKGRQDTKALDNRLGLQLVAPGGLVKGKILSMQATLDDGLKDDGNFGNFQHA